MVFFHLAEAEARVAQARVGVVVLRRRLDVALAFDVIADRAANEICIFEATQISGDGIRRDANVALAVKGVGESARVGQ